MRVQRSVFASRRDGLERLGRDGKAVADAARVDHDVVGTSNENLSADGGDHAWGFCVRDRMPLLAREALARRDRGRDPAPPSAEPPSLADSGGPGAADGDG